MITAVIILLVIVFYPYVFYPVLLFVVSKLKQKRECFSTGELPMVSVIVPVHNGAALLPGKIENLKSISYPAEKIEVICISDGSTDDTSKVLKSLEGIKVIVLETRVGKELAIKEALKVASAELICLTDVGVSINPDGIRKMVSHFRDNEVGAVSSVDRTDFKSYVLETFHVAFENQIRLLEASVSSSVGASGSFFMALKVYLERLPYTCCSDLAIALECVKSGARVAVEPGAFGYYGKSEDIGGELNRKVRTITHGMNTLVTYKSVLNPFKYGLFTWQLASHKLSRWLSPVALALMLLIVLFNFVYAADLLVLQLAVAGVLLAWLIPPVGKKMKTNIALFGVYILALFSSISNVLSKNKQVIWEPTQRSSPK